MAGDTYKGDSPAKKIARVNYWTHVWERLGERMERTKHLILCSREGGDIGVLLGLNVPGKNIVAVDREESALRACARKWRGNGISFELGDVVDVARKYRSDLGSALLDFCSPMNDEVIRTIVRVMQGGLKSEAFCGAAVMMGREKTAMASTIDETRKTWGESLRTSVEEVAPIRDPVERLYALEELLAIRGEANLNASRALADLGPERAWASIVKQASDMPARPLGVRTVVLARSIQHACVATRRVIPSTSYVASYQSSTRTSRGVPMMYWGAVVHVQPTRLSKRAFARRWERMRGERMEVVHHRRYDETDLRRKALWLADRAASLGCRGGDANAFAAQVLNLDSPQQIAAWKAHRTMKTYSPAEDPNGNYQ